MERFPRRYRDRCPLKSPRQLQHEAPSDRRPGKGTDRKKLGMASALQILTRQADLKVRARPVAEPRVQARVGADLERRQRAHVIRRRIELQPLGNIQIGPELEL